MLGKAASKGIFKMNLAHPALKGNPTNLKINLPNHAGRRFLHRQPGVNGLGSASVFARELHKVAPDLYRLRLT